MDFRQQYWQLSWRCYLFLALTGKLGWNNHSINGIIQPCQVHSHWHTDQEISENFFLVGGSSTFCDAYKDGPDFDSQSYFDCQTLNACCYSVISICSSIFEPLLRLLRLLRTFQTFFRKIIFEDIEDVWDVKSLLGK